MSVAFMAGVTSCHDDLDYDDPNAITDGTGRVRMAFDFMPLAETTLDSRASTVRKSWWRSRSMMPRNWV